MAKAASTKSKKTSADEEVVKRLPPTQKVLRKLYLLSGNNCAMENCSHVLINSSGTMVGHICHIEAAEEKGPRFRKTMSNEDRRAIDNLLLLCTAHHAIVDDKANAKKWTVAKLQALKRNHEKNFSEIGETLERAFARQFNDKTAATPVHQPQSLAKLLAHPDFAGMTKNDKRSAIKGFGKFAEKLAVTPEEIREFMYGIIARSFTLKHDVANVHVEDVRDALDVSPAEINRFCAALGRYELGALHEEDDGHSVWINKPCSEADWCSIQSFCDAEGISLREIVVDRKLELLD